MDINLIISGNLTGFSRFFASPNSNELYVESKFDFDYRNFLTFLNNGEKAYAISFAPQAIAVSLITRVLDSFRRPGVLVVSLLLPRKQLVESIMDSQNKNAIYRLLNEVNDKFYEKNFLNGMINQNAAVLMQDYYSDILSHYRLITDANQRNINSHIDITSFNKRLGYVASMEDDMSSYLSTIYRKSYEGYHHIFFAPNAPQNIVEPPIEVVWYRVHIINNNTTLPYLVKLSDTIYRLAPNNGELDIEQNYTYEEVLAGNAGIQIKADLIEDTIQLNYRFKQEERTIKFVFEENGHEVPLSYIAPVIVEADGSKYNLSSDTYVFMGKEIYGRKKLESNNTNFTVKSESSVLDIQRLRDNSICYIQVEQSNIFDFNFLKPFDIPKTITLIRRSTGQREVHKVQGYKRVILSGRLEEWDYSIESDSYETITGHFPKSGNLNVDFKPKFSRSIPVRPTSDAVRTNNNVTSTTRVATSTPSKGGTIELSGGDVMTDSNTCEKRYKIKKWIYISLIFLLLGGGGYWGWENWLSERKDENPVEKTISFEFEDSKKKKINYAKLNKYELLKISCNSIMNEIEIEDKSTPDTIKYILISKPDIIPDSIELVVNFDGVSIGKIIKSFTEITEKEIIKLEIVNNDLLLYNELYRLNDLKKQSEDIDYLDWQTDNDHIRDLKNHSQCVFYSNLLKLSENLKPQKKVENQQKGNSQKTVVESNAMDSIPSIDVLSKWDVTENQIKEWDTYLSKHQKVKDRNTSDDVKVKLSARVEALKTVINYIKKGQRPSTENLSKEQERYIVTIFNNRENTLRNQWGAKGHFKDVASLDNFKKKVESALNIKIDVE